jgi:hypothetical protein
MPTITCPIFFSAPKYEGVYTYEHLLFQPFQFSSVSINNLFLVSFWILSTLLGNRYILEEMLHMLYVLLFYSYSSCVIERKFGCALRLFFRCTPYIPQ